MKRLFVHAVGAVVTLAAPAVLAQSPAGAVCTAPVTTCDGENSYYVASDDREKIQGQLEPLLKELRACLDAAGGRHVTPAIVMRFDADGKPVSARIDAGGYESLPCVAATTGKLANARSVRETAVRCEYGCPKPKPKPPPAAPPAVVPVPPAGPAQPAQPAQPQAGAPPAPAAPAPSGAPPAPAPPAAPAKPPKRTENVWYGWQNLIADGVASGVLLLGISTRSDGVTGAGILTYVFGSPTVHWVHANIGKGFGSMGMRILLPPVGAGIGAIAGLIVAARDGGAAADESAEDGAIAGLIIGMAIPSLIDAAAFAYEKVEIDDGKEIVRAPNPRRTFTMTPAIAPQRGGATVGVAATF